MKRRAIFNLLKLCLSLPLDCTWRFGGDVVDNSVDAAHFTDYPV